MNGHQSNHVHRHHRRHRCHRFLIRIVEIEISREKNAYSKVDAPKYIKPLEMRECNYITFLRMDWNAKRKCACCLDAKTNGFHFFRYIFIYIFNIEIKENGKKHTLKHTYI